MDAIIIDFKPVVVTFSTYENLYPIYRAISLKTIISILLSITKDKQPDTINLAIQESFKRLRNPLYMETDKLEIFYMALMDELEDEIYSSLNCNAFDLVFDSWVDDTTAIMRVE